MGFTSPKNIINFQDWSQMMQFTLIADVSQKRLSSLLYYPCSQLLDALCIISTFHTAMSTGFKRMCLHKCFDVNYWVGSLPEKNFMYPHCSYFPLPLTSIPVIELRVVWGFRVLLWANLSWCSKAEGPLTPACWLSLLCLPAACCHGYLSSVAGRCSSSLMYDTTYFTKH